MATPNLTLLPNDGDNVTSLQDQSVTIHVKAQLVEDTIRFLPAINCHVLDDLSQESVHLDLLLHFVGPGHCARPSQA